MPFADVFMRCTQGKEMVGPAVLHGLQHAMNMHSVNKMRLMEENSPLMEENSRLMEENSRLMEENSRLMEECWELC